MIVAQSKDGRQVFVSEGVFDFGAVGSEYWQMTEAEFNERTSWEAMLEFAEPLWREDAGLDNGTTDSLEEWVTRVYNDILGAMTAGWIELPGDYFAAELVGVGRVFGEGWHNGLEITDFETFAAIETAEGR